jgi:hypothetical protein
MKIFEPDDYPELHYQSNASDIVIGVFKDGTEQDLYCWQYDDGYEQGDINWYNLEGSRGTMIDEEDLFGWKIKS